MVHTEQAPCLVLNVGVCVEPAFEAAVVEQGKEAALLMLNDGRHAKLAKELTLLSCTLPRIRFGAGLAHALTPELTGVRYARPVE